MRPFRTLARTLSSGLVWIRIFFILINSSKHPSVPVLKIPHLYGWMCLQIILFNCRCLVCSVGFPGWPACSLHLYRAHGVALDLLRCPLCSHHTTHSAARLARHLDKHRVAPCRRCAPQRPQGQRWYSRKKCQICSKVPTPLNRIHDKCIL